MTSQEGEEEEETTFGSMEGIETGINQATADMIIRVKEGTTEEMTEEMTEGMTEERTGGMTEEMIEETIEEMTEEMTEETIEEMIDVTIEEMTEETTEEMRGEVTEKMITGTILTVVGLEGGVASKKEISIFVAREMPIGMGTKKTVSRFLSFVSYLCQLSSYWFLK